MVCTAIFVSMRLFLHIIDIHSTGLQVARVLLIFQLPTTILPNSEPLVFVHLFKTFSKPVPNLNLFHTSYAYRQRYKQGIVLPLTQIVQTCHLTPNFGAKVNRRWTSATILDLAPSFYLNPYLRYRDFHLLRHQVYLFQKAKEDFDHDIRRRRARRAPGV